jgi:hypothetical protein
MPRETMDDPTSSSAQWRGLKLLGAVVGVTALPAKTPIKASQKGQERWPIFHHAATFRAWAARPNKRVPKYHGRVTIDKKIAGLF